MKYKNVLIYGYKKSGQSVENLLIKNAVNYSIYDKDYRKMGGKYISRLSKKMMSTFDLVIVSPGVSVYSKDIILFHRLGVEVIGETEYASRYISTPIISVTGTNGKTTTTELITHILSSRYKVKALGNIGEPLSEAVGDDSLDYIVNEVSSFQLETVSRYSPKIKVLLNIDSDHLDWHKSEANYIRAKLNLVSNNKSRTITIVNRDDSNIARNMIGIKGRVLSMSLVDSSSSVYADDNYIYYSLKPKGKIDRNRIKLNTNIYNIMASILVAKLLKIDDEEIVRRLNTYKIASHKLEVIKKINGVTFIDDSKSTNVHSTMHALREVRSDSIILLLGGYDKGLDYGDIFTYFASRIKSVVAYGKCGGKIVKSAKRHGYTDIKRCKRLADAVIYATTISQRGDTVLLSPATSSFDEFSSYIERGEKYRSLVNKVEDSCRK